MKPEALITVVYLEDHVLLDARRYVETPREDPLLYKGRDTYGIGEPEKCYRV